MTSIAPIAIQDESRCPCCAGRDISIVPEQDEKTATQDAKLWLAPACPRCSRPQLAWAWRADNPDFVKGELVCQGCDLVLSVTAG